MDALNTKIKNILTEKTLKVRPENIKSGVTIFGIQGTLEEGIDTSDATATASDIAIENASIYTGSTPIGSIAEIQDNSVRFGVEAQNTTTAPQSIVLIVAGYKGNVMEVCKTVTIPLTVGAPMDTYYTESINVSGCDSVKGFIWSGVQALKPLGLAVGF